MFYFKDGEHVQKRQLHGLLSKPLSTLPALNQNSTAFYCIETSSPYGSMAPLLAALAIETELLSRRHEQGEIFLALANSYFK